MDLQFLVFLLNGELFLCASLSEAVSASLMPRDAEVSVQNAVIHSNY